MKYKTTRKAVVSGSSCTGYRGMPGRRANNVRKYEEAARDAAERLDWREAEAEIERLLAEFCAQA